MSIQHGGIDSLKCRKCWGWIARIITGCLIRVWIRTAPLAQWLVGWELRLRVKQSLAHAGIPLGIPRQDLSIQRTGFPSRS